MKPSKETMADRIERIIPILQDRIEACKRHCSRISLDVIESTYRFTYHFPDRSKLSFTGKFQDIATHADTGFYK